MQILHLMKYKIFLRKGPLQPPPGVQPLPPPHTHTHIIFLFLASCVSEFYTFHCNLDASEDWKQ